MGGAPTISEGGIYINHPGEDKKSGFNGYISRLEYTNKALSYEEIVSRYNKGPSPSIKKGFFE